MTHVIRELLSHGGQCWSADVHTAAANADYLLLHSPLLVRVTACKPQHCEGTVDRTALAHTERSSTVVVYFFISTVSVQDVWREATCVVVAPVCQMAHETFGVSGLHGGVVLKALCVGSLCMCIQDSPLDGSPVFIGQVYRQCNTAI